MPTSTDTLAFGELSADTVGDKFVSEGIAHVHYADGHSPKCLMCQREKARQTYVHWGRQTCSNGHTKEVKRPLLSARVLLFPHPGKAQLANCSPPPTHPSTHPPLYRRQSCQPIDRPVITSTASLTSARHTRSLRFTPWLPIPNLRSTLES